MSEQKTRKTPMPSQTRLVCRLRHKELSRGPSATSGEVELENVSSRVIEIDIDRHPLQYLDLLVTDAVGTVLPTRAYGDFFSPLGGGRVLRLAPGETYTASVSLLGTVPRENQRPGCYTVQAIYACGDLKAVSEPLLVRL